jgi:hypothetical protein
MLRSSTIGSLTAQRNQFTARRALPALLASLLALAIWGPPAASAQSITFPAESNKCDTWTPLNLFADPKKSFNGSVFTNDSAHPSGNPDCDYTKPSNCTATGALIRWGDGESSAPTSFSGVKMGDAPGSEVWDIKGSHVYEASGKFKGAVDITFHCVNNQGAEYDGKSVGQPGGAQGFVMTVDPKCKEFKLHGDGCYYDNDQKKLFQTLARIAHDGYVVDAAIDDVISIPEDFITDKLTGKGLVTEFVVGKFWGKYVEDKILPKIPSFGKLPDFKRVPYNEILDAPKYAKWLDYSKYWVLNRLADDPPDPNFDSLAQPRALRGIPDAVPALGDTDAREVALYVALLTSVERAAGALAAGDPDAEAEQMRHASGLANRLVTLLGAKQRALKKAANVVGKMPALRLPEGLVKRAVRSLDSKASDRFERKALLKLGFSAERIDAVQDVAPDVRIKDLTKPLGSVLGLEAQAKVIGRERAALASFANQYALAE